MRKYKALFTVPNSGDTYSIPFNVEADHAEDQDDLSPHEVGEVIVSGVPGAAYLYTEEDN